MSISSSIKEEISLKKFKEKVLDDFRTVSLSLEVSVQGRREVLHGKGKFVKYMVSCSPRGILEGNPGIPQGTP